MVSKADAERIKAHKEDSTGVSFKASLEQIARRTSGKKVKTA